MSLAASLVLAGGVVVAMAPAAHADAMSSAFAAPARSQLPLYRFWNGGGSMDPATFTGIKDERTERVYRHAPAASPNLSLFPDVRILAGQSPAVCRPTPCKCSFSASRCSLRQRSLHTGLYQILIFS